MGPWTVNGVHWLAENGLTSQILQLLFMHCSKICPQTHEKKKKNRKTQTQTQTLDQNVHKIFTLQ